MTGFLFAPGTIRPRHLATLFVLASLAWHSPVLAAQLVCGDPNADGRISIKISSPSNDNVNSVVVNIKAADDASDKAANIAAVINSPTYSPFSATTNGPTITIVNDQHPSETVTISIESDKTGESDLAKCSAGDQGIFVLAATASGSGWAGGSATIQFGTSVHSATVNPSFGQTPLSILTAIRNDLVASGIANVVLTELPGGGAQLRITAGSTDTGFVIRGDDTGAGYRFLYPIRTETPGVSPTALAGLATLLAATAAVALRRRSRMA